MQCDCCAKRPADLGYCCRICFDRMQTWLAQIPVMFDSLVSGHALDPLPAVFPNRTGVVCGTREPRLPIDVDVLDLALAVEFSPGHDHMAYAEDQTGYAPVLTELDRWCVYLRRDWFPRDRLPELEVSSCASWLSERLEGTVGVVQDTPELHKALRRIWLALGHVLGEHEPADQWCRHVRCPKCHARSLSRTVESNYRMVECSMCGVMLTDEQYRDWLSESVTQDAGIHAPDSLAA